MFLQKLAPPFEASWRIKAEVDKAAGDGRMPLCSAAADQVERRTAARKLAEQARNAEKVAAVKREEQKKLHALRRCMRSEQIVRFKGSPFSKAGADNSREGIVKEIVFIRPRHDTKMPDYIAVELLLRRTAAVDTVASSSPPPPPPPPHRSIVECSGSSPVFDRERFGAYAIWLGEHFKWYKEQAGEWISMCSSAAAGVASVGGRD